MPRGKTPQGYWPNFESKFLSEIVTALRKKSKSLKHSVSTYSCERIRERTEGVESEKLEMSFELWDTPPIWIAFNCRDDRWMWLDIRQSANSGWKFEWQHEGRIGVTEPTAVANLLLRSVQFPYGENITPALRFLDEQWKSVAITGPRGEVK